MSKTLRVVILEDCAEDAELMAYELGRGDVAHEWQLVSDEQDYRTALESPCDVILADFDLPSFDAMAALRVAQQLAPDTPFIIVSGQIDEAVAVEAIRRGADDYLLKDRLTRLPSAVSRAVERRALEQAQQREHALLRELEQQYRILDRVSPVGIAQADHEGQWQTANQRWRQWSGLDTADSLGDGWLTAVHGDDRPTVREQWQRSVTSDQRFHCEFRLSMADRWMLAQAEPQRDERQQVTGYIVTITDISRRIALEEEHRQLLMALNERNHLRASIKAHESVLSVVGHELRTPLAGARAMAELLLSDSELDPQQARSYLASIYEQTVRMATMINNLLEVARLNSGTAQWNWGRVPVAKLCEAAVDEVSPVLAQKNVRVEMNLPDRDLTITGDAEALRRVMDNLLDNACHFTSAGSVSVLASQSADQLEIQVRDTGQGMSPKLVTQLGKPFAISAGIVGERHCAGAGLGLAICNGIIAAHGGRMTIRSETNEGTTVTIKLPTDQRDPAQQSVGPNSAE